ncbi:MAG: hypothetical protein GEU82_08010 [Luteitalea sp.]|nr:hypothetical protein [Luteitalea sp.]
MTTRVTGAALAAAIVWLAAPILHGQASAEDLVIRALLRRLEAAAQQGDPAAYGALLTASANPGAAADFAATEFVPGATRVVVQERERQRLRGTLPGDGYSLTLDAFMEYGDRARVATWQVDVRKSGETEWRIAGQERVSAVENLYRLSVNTRKQFEARDFTIVAEDLELTLVEGSVFTIETEQGVTGLVLLGRGEMRFRPAPEMEKGQIRIFAGADTLETRFDAAYVRVGYFNGHADPSALIPRPVDPRELKRAEQIFREESAKSFVVDLADLTRDAWSLLPGQGDFLAEIRTRRFETLTYARSLAESEDVSLFDRRRKRNISVYPSKEKLATRGRFYNEDELTAYDVQSYEIEVTAIPDRQWIDGRAKLRLKVKAAALGQLTVRLADSLVVRSVVSAQFGRLFSLRVTNQNTILVNLPAMLMQGTELTLTIDYSGRLEPQPADRETLALQRPPLPSIEDGTFPRIEPSFLYSNRSYWYPQPTITDYATASIMITIPAAFGCVATGEVSSDSPQLQPAKDPEEALKTYLFTAERPVRYLAFIISRLVRADRWTVVFNNEQTPPPQAEAATVSSPAYDRLDLIVEANPRQNARGREVAERAVDVVQFYESIIGDSPYPSFTVALIESLTPGGHSPGYFAALNQTLPTSGVTWRNDPAAFHSYPEFFLAHEVAHQWWGQAVGWRNYHEQWLSEGFAQYFATLYAQHFRGDEVFDDVMRQMRKWAIDQTDQGPVYLGYRVGHLRSDGRAFRAIIYNKGAVVLHMMRRLLGDDAFFRGVRRFYAESRFQKVGSEDLRTAMEAEAGRSLERFFERWVYGSALPQMSYSYRVEPGASGQEVVIRFEQAGELFDLPVTVTLQYADRRTEQVVVPVWDRVAELRVPLQGVLRAADISDDDGTLAEITRTP